MSVPGDVVDEVRAEVRGGIGRLTLARPRAMNALTLPMVTRALEQLQAWQDDPGVQAVVLDGEGDRGLCAGGDLKMFYASARSDRVEVSAFFRTEYAMNALIADFRKPVVALMTGAVLGGGVGFSAHARHRLVALEAQVGMPEVGIGFVPDVGGTWLLGRAPGELGTWLGVTGSTVGPADAVLCGLADAVVSASVVEAVRQAPDFRRLMDLVVSAGAAVDGAVLPAWRPWIDRCFRAPTVREIVVRLREESSADAQACAELLQTRSPEAVELTLLAVRRARELPSLSRALALELAVSLDSLGRHDFLEGIRAQVIDRDRTPHWEPSSLAEVDVPALARQVLAWSTG